MRTPACAFSTHRFHHTMLASMMRCKLSHFIGQSAYCTHLVICANQSVSCRSYPWSCYFAFLSSACACMQSQATACLISYHVICSAGATVQRMQPVSITNPDHFVNVARRKAAQQPNSIFADQFENLANFRAHLQTGQEVWEQCGGHLDGFVCGAGTGGTIAGVSTYLKQQQPDVQVYLIDPPGSSLYNKVSSHETLEFPSSLKF